MQALRDLGEAQEALEAMAEGQRALEARAMKYAIEFRDPAAAHGAAGGHRRARPTGSAPRATKPVHIMEICGGHTHSIFRYGLDKLIHAGVEFIHGPGCPVCVLPMARVDEAVRAGRTARGDLHHLRRCDAGAGPPAQVLMQAKAAGADIRMVYSPLDALELARRNPDREVVFFGLGFETTTPSTALSIQQAAREGLTQLQRCSATTSPCPNRSGRCWTIPTWCWTASSAPAMCRW